MISINQAREIDPNLKDLSDEELEKVLLELYELGGLALEAYFDRKEAAKIPEVPSLATKGYCKK